MRREADWRKCGSGIGVFLLFFRVDRPGMKDHWSVLERYRYPCLGVVILLLKKTVTLEPWAIHGC